MKKLISIVIISALLVLSIGTMAQAQTNIEVWHYFADSKGMEYVVDEFNSTHSDIKVESKFIHFSELENQITKGLMSGNIPDVLITGSDTLAKWAENGALLDITERANEWGMEDKFFEGAWESGMYEGSLYAIPQNINTIAIFYNKDLFKEAGLSGIPNTWEQLRTYAEKISGLGEKTYGLTFSASKDESSTFQFAPFLWQSGASFENINSEDGQAALSFWADMIEEGYTPKSVLNTPQYELAINFAAGNVGMCVNGPWALSAFEDAEFDYGVFMMPVRKNVGKSYSVLGGESIGVMKDSDKKDAAWEFVKFFNEPEVIKEWCKIENRIPGRKDVVNNTPMWSEDEIMLVFSKQLEYAKARPAHPNYPQISAAIQTAIQKGLTGGEVKEALNTAQEKIDSVLNE